LKEKKKKKNMDVNAAFDEWVKNNCHTEPDSETRSIFLTKALQFPFAIALVFTLIVGLFKRELLLMTFGIGIQLNYLINFLVSWLLASPSLIEGCGPIYSLPIYDVQFALFFYLFLVISHLVYKWRLGLYNSVIFVIWIEFVGYSAIYFKLGTVIDVIWSAWFGSGFALLLHVVIYYAIRPHVDTILEWKFSKWIELVDNYIRPK
jgi:hypothetical protein